MENDKEKLKKLQSMKVRKVGGGIRQKNRPNRKAKESNGLDFWKIADKFDTYSLPNVIQIVLVKNDKSTIEINSPLVKTVNKGNTVIVYRNEKNTTIKHNAQDDSIKIEEWGDKERTINSRYFMFVVPLQVTFSLDHQVINETIFSN